MAKKTKPAPPAPIALERLDVVYVGVDEVKPNSYNPNRQSEADFNLLLKSMEDDGFTQPVIVDRVSMEIVDGEHRWRAAQALDSRGVAGFQRIPVVFVDMTPEQRRIATLRHNRARGSEDYNAAAELLRSLAAGELDRDDMLESLQMQGSELDNILADAAIPETAFAAEVVAAKERDPEDRAAIADATRAAERRIADEKVVQSAEMQRQGNDLFRVDLTFTDEESELVKRVLGKTPAARLLELCKEELALRATAAVPEA